MQTHGMVTHTYMESGALYAPYNNNIEWVIYYVLMRYGLQGQLGVIQLMLFRSGPEQAERFDLGVFSDFKNTFFFAFQIQILLLSQQPHGHRVFSH